jgi:hypothetical protein
VLANRILSKPLPAAVTNLQLRSGHLRGTIEILKSSPQVHEAKNRISWKIKNVAQVSKVPLKIQNNSRRSKTVAGKFKSSAERLAFRRKFETAAGELKSSAEKLNLPLKI